MLSGVSAFSVERNGPRRAFLAQATGSVAALLGAQHAAAAPEVVTTPSGIKYVITKPPKEAPKAMKGDIIVIEYTGYLPNGQIFDATHAEGKKNALMFQLGGNAVIDGVNEMVAGMGVGEKRQVIMPASMAFKDKGICVEKDGSDSECLIKPGQALVYDISLKRASIPPP